MSYHPKDETDRLMREAFMASSPARLTQTDTEQDLTLAAAPASDDTQTAKPPNKPDNDGDQMQVNTSPSFIPDLFHDYTKNEDLSGDPKVFVWLSYLFGTIYDPEKAQVYGVQHGLPISADPLIAYFNEARQIHQTFNTIGTKDIAQLPPALRHIEQGLDYNKLDDAALRTLQAASNTDLGGARRLEIRHQFGSVGAAPAEQQPAQTAIAYERVISNAPAPA